MNHMEEVAKLLDVKLNEPFNIGYGDNNEYSETFYLTNAGLWCNQYTDAESSAELLEGLLIGRLHIIKKPWKPANGDTCWVVNPDSSFSEFKFDKSSSTHIALYALNKLYNNPQEALDHISSDAAYWNELYQNIVNDTKE